MRRIAMCVFSKWCAKSIRPSRKQRRSSPQLPDAKVGILDVTGAFTMLINIAFLLASHALSAPYNIDQSADRAAITKNISELSAPGCLPGPISVSGKGSFVLITGKSGGINVPVFGAAFVGKGRAIAGGHEGFFGEQALATADNARFLVNSLCWLSGKKVQQLRIGLLDMPGMKRTIVAEGGVAEEINPTDIPERLNRYNAICLNQGVLDRMPEKQKAVVKYLENGGGLLIAGPAWGWLYGAGDKTLASDHTGNAILRQFGLGFADGGLDGPFTPVQAGNPLLAVDSALVSLKQGNLSKKDSAVALKTVETIISILPDTDKQYLPRIELLAKQESTTSGPDPKNPIDGTKPFARLSAMLYSRRSKLQSPTQIKAHPSAASFPGSVPEKAPRVAKTFDLDTKAPNWHGSGLYAAPGEAVTVEIPQTAVQAGLGVRIGCHTDTLWHLEKWERFPEISTYAALKTTKTTVCNPFGGTIYIDVPERCQLGSVEVKVSNAVDAPRFVRGKTSLEEWQKTIRNNPGPWAELEGNLVILSVPSTSVRDLDNPEALMAYWDKVMEACYTVYAAPKRNRPERYCVDRQISAGYMHSGYPIMTFEDVAKTFCDLPKLKQKGSHLWGFYHEMGHNFQEGSWTFEGTGEVTNNLFSVYGQEAVVGLTKDEFGLAHPALKEPDSTNRLRKYLADGAKFSTWQDDPFLALTMYLQLRKAFGWEPMTRVFESYRKGPQPRTEMDRHDEWMVRMSKSVGKNLGPFFDAWGVPVTQKAKDSIKELPSWMPSDWPKQ